ncbi:unnamed protein product [Rotaria sordida]|uniref:Uncharacterized protein n=1 Tax=Rotaria sordida TaxID=392033 RepID=A0A819QIM2_9BILA|nr:unnamed protein product [Rotaria sordida]
MANELPRLYMKYSCLLNIYQSYAYAIQRTDLARLVVLHFEGGIYADLDVFPQEEAIEQLRSSVNSCLTNHFLVAEQNSNILDFILHRIPPASFYRRMFIPYLDVFSTRDVLLTRHIREWFKSSLYQPNKLWILSFNEASYYIDHGTGRSWHLFDGYLLNKIQDVNYF